MVLDLQQIANLAQAISALAIVVLIYQLYATKRAEIGRNSIELLNYLQQNETRSARRRVITRLHGKSSDGYDYEDNAAAGTVCASYEHTGVLVKRGMVDKEMFLHSWGASIIVTRHILSGYLALRRQEMGLTYYSHFDWLRDEARKYHHKLGSKIELAQGAPRETEATDHSKTIAGGIGLQQPAAS